MVISTETKHGVDVPVLTNSKELLPHTKLVRWKPKPVVEVKPLASATIVEGNVSGPPNKRGRKSR